MGIINLTDNSYFSSSSVASLEQFKERAEEMVLEGASIIDIGACSTRPGSRYVDIEQEWERLKPALEWIVKLKGEVAISIDTFRSSIVERAYHLIGNFIVNDISSGEEDEMMLSTVGKLKLPYIGMHKRGTPEVMQSLTDYQDVLLEVKEYLQQLVKRAEEAGVEKVAIDPGFGFAKTLEQNYTLLKGVNHFMEVKSGSGRVPIVVGISRKSMIYRPLNITPEEALSATSALHLYALQNGANILRVHDVKEAQQIVKLYNLISQTS